MRVTRAGLGLRVTRGDFGNEIDPENLRRAELLGERVTVRRDQRAGLGLRVTRSGPGLIHGFPRNVRDVVEANAPTAVDYFGRI